MENTTTQHDAHDENGPEPHMPAPSLSPIILAAGLTFLVFGLVLGPVFIAIGVIGTLLGLGTWLYDEIQNANAGEH
jgi:hypothetical protein